MKLCSYSYPVRILAIFLGLALGLWSNAARSADVQKSLDAAPQAVTSAPLQQPITQGQRVFICGHSFHVFVASPLTEVAKMAGIKDHVLAGTQSIGGSRTIQHWNLPDDKNRAKQALIAGNVDVLTLSPHLLLPDEGIDRFTELALAHNPNIRILIQASWMPYDGNLLNFGQFKNEDRKKTPLNGLRQGQAEWFKKMEAQVQALNQKYGKQAVFIVPVGEAVMVLREKIAQGQAPGLKSPDEMFKDGIGHPTAPVMALCVYCQFAAIYRRTPVGLPMPQFYLKARGANTAWDEKLNLLLQQIAWEAVSKYPFSGVKP
ncbi:MAG: hypothetical protein NTX50_19575 [Candidatus Sumerlaeota bacterium]|nr:hypothetical protein [Candidatus Sumerlaeota bacterium]